MSEEEKKAIDKLKRSANYFVMPIYETTIILNLIEKQQKEIENLKEINKEHQKLNGELRDEIDDLKQLMAHKNGYTKQLEEDLFENASNYVVSKDKIREKIEEYKKPKKFKEVDQYGEIIEGEIIYKDVVAALKKLLKEE